MDAFQGDESVRLPVGNLQAARVGILIAATHVVVNNPDWVPGNHWQAEDRIDRIGQTSATFATYWYAPGTLDGYMAALLEEKARNIGVLEAEAATTDSLLEAVVNGARSGDGQTREPAMGADRSRVAAASPTSSGSWRSWWRSRGTSPNVSGRGPAGTSTRALTPVDLACRIHSPADPLLVRRLHDEFTPFNRRDERPRAG